MAICAHAQQKTCQFWAEVSSPSLSCTNIDLYQQEREYAPGQPNPIAVPCIGRLDSLPLHSCVTQYGSGFSVEERHANCIGQFLSLFI
jgi:hypothetical protein